MDYWHGIRRLAGREPLIIPSAAGAIVQDGKVLLVRHNSLKKWQIPLGEVLIQGRAAAQPQLLECVERNRGGAPPDVESRR